MNRRIAAFKYAIEGIVDFFTHHFHPKVHLFFAFLAIVFAWFFNFSGIEWCILLLCIGVVLAAEAFNTAIEYLCNKITLENDIAIKKTKDMAAGGVLIVSILALAIGLILFLPKIWAIFNHKI